MRWPRLLAVLKREPLGYRLVKGKSGTSHRKLVASGRPDLHMGFHNKEEIGGVMIRRILVDQVGLTETEARALCR